MAKRLAFGLCFATIFVSCASVSVLKQADPVPLGRCKVNIHTSLEAAKSKGEIEELCLVSGTSSGSFSHTVGTAIEKNKNKVCECGATEAYIQAQDAGTLGTASVTLVGFRYTSTAVSVRSEPINVDKSAVQKKAKKCQEKGGVWINDRCEIDLNDQ